MNDVAVILYSVTRATCVNNGPAGLRLRFLVCRLPVARGYMRYSCDFSKKIPSCHRPYYVTSLQRRLSSDSVCPRTGYCLRGSIVDKLCVLLDSCFCGRRRVFFSSILSCFCRCCVQLEECGHDCVPSVLIPPPLTTESPTTHTTDQHHVPIDPRAAELMPILLTWLDPRVGPLHRKTAWLGVGLRAD